MAELDLYVVACCGMHGAMCVRVGGGEEVWQVWLCRRQCMPQFGLEVGVRVCDLPTLVSCECGWLIDRNSVRVWMASEGSICVCNPEGGVCSPCPAPPLPVCLLLVQACEAVVSAPEEAGNTTLVHTARPWRVL